MAKKAAAKKPAKKKKAKGAPSLSQSLSVVESAAVVEIDRDRRVKGWRYIGVDTLLQRCQPRMLLQSVNSCKDKDERYFWLLVALADETVELT